MRAGRCRASPTRLPSSRSELTQKDIRQKPGLVPGFLFSVAPMRANPKIYFTTHVYPAAYTHVHAVTYSVRRKVPDCDNFIVSLLSTALRVTFPTPVVLRGATCRAGHAMRGCKTRGGSDLPFRCRACSGRIPAAQGYPEKQSRKTSSR